MTRNALFASFVALGVTAGGAQAADPGPWLVNTGGDLGVVYAAQPANVAGGAHAAIAGGGDNMNYQAAPDARTQEAGPAAALTGGGEDARLVYEQFAPAAVRLADARLR